jgi:putative transport protein
LHDRIRLVGQSHRLPEFEALIGPRAKPDAPQAASPMTTKRLYVTKAAVVGRTLGELALEATHGAVATRVTRSGVEFTARAATSLHVGDLLRVVGPQEAVEAVAQRVGNEPKALDHPPLLALFAGIFCGVVLGAVPIVLPGLPAPVRLGLAGGPLLVALGASQLGRLGPLNWYLTPGANFVLREFGIAMFLACVGLKAGHGFLATVLSARGVLWAVSGTLITVLPLLAGMVVGRKALRLDDAALSGVLAGSMTDPPALAFASSLSDSEAPLVAYAAVYPLTMVLRVFFAQVLVLLTFG